GRGDDLGRIGPICLRPRRVRPAGLLRGEPDNRSSLDRGLSPSRLRCPGPPSPRSMPAEAGMIVSFRLNGEETTFQVAHPANLLDVLRDDLGLPGSKSAC